MFIVKKFAGLQQVGSGLETEPQDGFGGVNEIDRLLTVEAYHLFHATRTGANIDFEELVQFLKTGEASKDIVTLPVKEKEQSNMGDLLKKFLKQHAEQISFADAQKLQAFIDSLGASSRDAGGNYYTENENHIQTLQEVRDIMIKSGFEITDEVKFVKSMRAAIEQSDQGGLE